MLSELFFSGRRSAEPKTYGRFFFFRKGLNTNLVRTLFFIFLVLQVPRSTRNFFFFLPHCQNVYDIAGSFSHALYSRMVDQTKKMASVVGSFEAMFFLHKTSFEV